MRKAMVDAHHGPCLTLSAAMGEAARVADDASMMRRHQSTVPVELSQLGQPWVLGSTVTVLVQAATHVPPGGRTLSTTLVSAVVDPPNSLDSSTRSPSMSSALGSGSTGAYAPSSIYGPSQLVITLGCAFGLPHDFHDKPLLFVYCCAI